MAAVLNPKGFKLPRVEKEKFVVLIRLGLEYNREQCLYSINNYNNIEKLLETLGNILNTEVMFLQTVLDVEKIFLAQNATTMSYARPKTCRLVVFAPNV